MTEFGLELGLALMAKDPALTLSQAMRAEQLGFNCCWIAEDYFYGGALVSATACACRTSTVKVGIGVLNPYTRHPALIAMEVSVLQEVAEGRVILGMGTSNPRWIEQQMGMQFRRPLQALKESVEVVRRLLRGETVDYCGEVFRTSGISLECKVPSAEVPLFLGVKGPQALELAGEIGDGVLLSAGTSPDYVRFAVERITVGASRAKRDPSGVVVGAYIPTCCLRDRKRARDLVRPAVARYLGIHGAHLILTTAGLAETQILRFREAFLEGADASELVTDDLIDTFAVAGDASECLERLLEFREAGLRQIIMLLLPDMPVSEIMETIGSSILH